MSLVFCVKNANTKTQDCDAKEIIVCDRPDDSEDQRILAIPDWVQYEIDHPKAMGQGRNNQMIKIGPTLIRNGLTPEQVDEIFHTMFPDGPSAEIDAVVTNSMKFAKVPAITTPNEALLRRRGLLNDAANALPRILKKYARSVPETPKRSLQEQRRLFLTTLFQPNDVLWIGEVFQKNFLSLEDWLKKPAISFFNAFLDIADIRVRVSSAKSPIHERPPYREFGFEVPEYFECSNPRCKNGRLRLWPLIRMAHAKRETSIQFRQVCNGRERGRKPNTPCLYSFNVEGKITYKP
jgi:hypothetical protein